MHTILQPTKDSNVAAVSTIPFGGANYPKITTFCDKDKIAACIRRLTKATKLALPVSGYAVLVDGEYALYDKEGGRVHA